MQREINDERHDTQSFGEPREARLSDLAIAVRGLFKRRWKTFIAIAAAIFAIAATIIVLMAPHYEAMARLRIDPSRDPLTVSSGNQVDVTLSTGAIDTEVSVLGSDELVRDVVRRLKLEHDPELAAGFDQKLAKGELGPEDRVDFVAEQLKKNLTVEREQQTYVIAISFFSEKPVQAARVANGLAEAYIDTRVGSRVGTAERQAEFLRERAEQLAAEARSADAALAKYRAAAGIVEGGTAGTIADQQIGPLSSQLANAESEAAAARAMLAVARRQRAAGGIDAIAEVRSSPVIADLRRQRAEVGQEFSEISARYGPRHPATVKVTDQLASLDAQISAEAERAVGTLEAQASSAQARVDSLRASLRALEAQQAGNTQASVRAESLERDAAAKRAAYEKMSQMYLDATQSTHNLIANAEIVDPARTPLRPAPPSKMLLLSLALVVALAAGFAAIVMQELLVGGMRSVEDLERDLGLPLLASVPRLNLRKGESPAARFVRNPNSMYGEALRNVRASLLGVGAVATPCVIAVTSALPAEGKTTLSLSLARMLALNGARTLLIDCDTRKATLRQIADVTAQRGLVEVLTGRAALDEVVTADEVDGLDLIVVKERFFSAEDLFSDGRMASLLEEARGRYHQVVLDLPPIMAVADARVLATMADNVALVVRWGKTPLRAAQSALAMLSSDGARIGGAIYNSVDPNSEAMGGYYYSAKAGEYYARA